MGPNPDPQIEAMDLALGVGRSAMSKLRRLRSEIVDSQDGQQVDMFWPFAVLRALPQVARRRRIAKLTALLQTDLSALDAAVEVLRGVGLSLPVRAASQARKGKPDSMLSSMFGRQDRWAGAMQLVQSTKYRVAAILDELRR